MRYEPACWSFLLVIAMGAAPSAGGPINAAPNAPRRAVAFFEPPRSIGTPLEDLARTYAGPGLAGRIAGRLMLDTDPSLHPAARELIRRRLAQGS